MKIGIDIREGIRKNPAGPGMYVRSLVNELTKLYPKEVFIFFTDSPVLDTWSRRANVRIVGLSRSAILFQLGVFFLLEFARLVDVYFSPTSFIAPALVRRVPVVTTLFDFSTLRLARLGRVKAVFLERLFLRLALRFSKRVLAISETIAREAQERYPFLVGKLLVTLLAPALPGEESPLKNLPDRFFLLMGTLEPRKNLSRVLAAYRDLKRENSKGPALILAGSLGWGRGDFEKKLKEHPFREEIYILGYVTDAQKVFLYRRAEALLYVSLYEGFGLPIVEAFTLGCPVITSRRGAMEEVAGEAALLVDPENTADITEAMEQISSSSSLARRLKEGGRRRAEVFSWEQTANISFQAFKEAVS